MRLSGHTSPRFLQSQRRSQLVVCDWSFTTSFSVGCGVGCGDYHPTAREESGGRLRAHFLAIRISHGAHEFLAMRAAVTGSLAIYILR